MYLIGHRGNTATAPENTMRSFQEAFNLGASGVELDVALTKDDQVVVFHDDTLDRTTDGRGLLKNFTYNELAKLDAGTWFSPQFAKERIPLLEEVLSTFKNKGRFLIESKDKSERMPILVNGIVSLIRKYHLQDSAEILSFHDEVVAYVAAHFGNEIATQKFIFAYVHPIPVCIGRELNIKPLASYSDVTSFGFDLFMNKSLIEHAIALKKRVYLGAYQQISLEDAQNFKRWGITGIMRNDVAPFLSLL